MEKRIKEIDIKLEKLRSEWKKGSSAMKKWIEVGAKLLKAEKARLEAKAEKDSSQSML